MSEIDWASLQKDADDVLLPDGQYPVIVKQADAVMSSTGKPMIKLRLRVLEGPKKDRILFTQLTLSVENPVALRMWFLNLAAFGLGPDYFATVKPSMAQLATDLTSRGALVTVSRAAWQGTDRNQVDKIEAYTPNGPIPPGLVLGTPTVGPGPVGSPVPSPAVSPISGPPVPTTPAATAPPAASPVPATPGTPPPAQPF